MAYYESLEAWERALEAKIDSMKTTMNWIKNGADLSMDALQRYAEELVKWKVNNPRPKAPLRKPPTLPGGAAQKIPVPHGKPEPLNLAKLDNDFRNAQRIRTTQRFRRGGQGFITLTGLLVGVGVSATAIGTALVAYVVEEMVWTAGEKVLGSTITALAEYGTPSTLDQCHVMYRQYYVQQMQLRTRFGSSIQILTEPQWAESVYGVRIDVL